MRPAVDGEEAICSGTIEPRCVLAELAGPGCGFARRSVHEVVLPTAR